MRFVTAIAALCLALPACGPDVGSEEWCAKMRQERAEKPREEWTVNQEMFAKECVEGGADHAG